MRKSERLDKSYDKLDSNLKWRALINAIAAREFILGAGDAAMSGKTLIGLLVLATLLQASTAIASDIVYAYDVHGQLVGVTRASSSTSYDYDKAGNRRQTTGQATTASSMKAMASTASVAETSDVSSKSSEVQSRESVALPAQWSNPALWPQKPTVFPAVAPPKP